MRKTDLTRAKKAFSTLLLRWNREENSRQMPWKGEADPYRIWLSEIILQQTRVEQGLDYYNRFIEKYPGIHQLAAAPDEAVFKLWEGLGYYSRCRNLLATARFISSEKKGVFPSTYESIKELKGIGPYTAAAISSFAFNLPHAVVDGNVFRVLSRVFGIELPIDSTNGKKYFTELANELLSKEHPAAYNQAIMDFGATVCKPISPRCEECVFQKMCFAYNNDRVQQLPVKEKKTTIRKRWFYYLVLEQAGKRAVRQRQAKDIWNQLYEFPLIEMKREEDVKTVLAEAQTADWLPENAYELVSVSPLFRQQLSHQFIAGQFLRIRLKNKTKIGHAALWLTSEQLSGLAFPKIINEYLAAR